MKIMWLVIVGALVGCSGSGTRHTPDGAGSGTGSGVPMPCNINVASTPITASTTSTGSTCTPQLVNNTTVAINFSALSDANNQALAEISCIIQPGVVPQTLGFRANSSPTGCTVVINYNSLDGTHMDDMWSSTAASTVQITVTDLPTASGTIHLVLDDGMGTSMTVTGTF